MKEMLHDKDIQRWKVLYDTKQLSTMGLFENLINKLIQIKLKFHPFMTKIKSEDKIRKMIEQLQELHLIAMEEKIYDFAEKINSVILGLQWVLGETDNHDFLKEFNRS